MSDKTNERGLTALGQKLYNEFCARLQPAPTNPRVLVADIGESFAWPAHLAEDYLGDDYDAVIMQESEHGIASIVHRGDELKVTTLLTNVSDGVRLTVVPITAVSAALEAL